MKKIKNFNEAYLSSWDDDDETWYSPKKPFSVDPELNKKENKEFAVGDIVICKDSDSQFHGQKGEIFKLISNGVFMIRFKEKDKAPISIAMKSDQFIKYGSSVKEKKEKKIFAVGDIVICIDEQQGKLSPDAIEYLKTFNRFKILGINDSRNIDIGYKTDDGNIFYFSPNRFDLKDKPKEISSINGPDQKESEKKKVIDMMKQKYKFGFKDEDYNKFKKRNKKI